MIICPVILVGGAGTRLWPLSRSKHPKQFFALNNEYTMLQNTLMRLSGLTVKDPIFICNEDHRFFVAEQLRAIDQHGSIILEPEGKNTAPAIALAALQSLEKDPLLLVLSADHEVKDIYAFQNAIKSAINLAESGKLVTFGIVPNEPHTGYGYIKTGSAEGSGYTINSFIEKPSLRLAEDFLKSKDYYWNSGMFLFKASALLSELNKFRPDIYQACKDAMSDNKEDLDFIRINENAFRSCPSESIDYAVMENTDNGVMVPMNAGWSDIGSWLSLWKASEKDKNDNFHHGDIICHDTNGCYIRSEDKLIAAVGINDLVIVSTKDAVMVAHKNNVQDIKKITDKLKDESRSEHELHREVFRPWGKYDSVDIGEGYQVKRITVKPGAKLSLQKHHHRSEHWIVVVGTAKVTIEEETFLLSVNESTYIPVGSVHALENPEKIDLELIEVQTGSYLGEDDIVRLQDVYGRVSAD
ncbi:mannose-1-phosphate guanylyltransferase/mannose-6-phosphate isomerase [SAR86 cluster bacterium SAR86E]|uniref:mannose-1-phosphate guanylyltransferase n=1 Tax=SAR86 cluster bacterium SAR86E TaxID=1208365 RepID=K6H0N5_9GAMM|nr:mannose-1-phosphate guanylyltransferase/mannose-6-phosphate isomerase [SAR86 cluster bacterium SAR86E]